MFIVTIFAATLLTFLFFLIKSKVNDPGIPLYPDKWPILGHVHLFLGDNIKLYDSLKKISMFAVGNGGCTIIHLGIAKFYMFTDPDDISTILRSTTEKHYTYSFAKHWLGNGLTTAPTHVWQANKKLLYPMFQQQTLNQFLTIFNQQSRRLVHQFSDHNGKGAFNHECYLFLTSLETICQTALGSDVGEEMARNTEYVAAIEGVMDCIITRFKKVWLHLNAIYQVSSLKVKHDKNLLIINNFSKELINKRKLQFDHVSEVDKGEFNYFVDTIFKVAQTNKNFDEKQILDEINTLIFGGNDTTAHTLIFCLMLLGHHQDVQDKVYKELQEVFGNTDRDVDKFDLPKLVFLEAVVKETLRLYTIFPIFARKISTNLKLKKYTLSAGADCFVSLYGLHRNPEWGKDANEFNPDRWMNPETLPKNSNLFAPFGGGKRYCVGRSYAMMSIKTTLAHVLRHYRIKADMNKLVTQMVVILKPASGHHILLESRTDLANERE